MERIGRPRFTREQKAELWERWKSGESPSDNARALERRTKGGVYRILASTGGIVRRSYTTCSFPGTLAPLPFMPSPPLPLQA